MITVSLGSHSRKNLIRSSEKCYSRKERGRERAKAVEEEEARPHERESLI